MKFDFHLCLVVVLLGINGSKALAQKRTFTNSRHNFSVEYPDSWHLSAAEDRFSIDTFGESGIIKIYRIPRGGAEIIVLAEKQVEVSRGRLANRNLDSWIESAHIRRVLTKRSNLDLSRGGRILQIRQFVSVCCSDHPRQETIHWFFEIDNHFFEALLGYWQGDLDVRNVFKTFEDVVTSIRLSSP